MSKNPRQFRHAKTGQFRTASIIALASGLTVLSSGIEAQAQTKIEQIIVTATKRAQDVQSVPASISAFSGEGLAERQIKNVEDITRATPNLNFSLASGAFPVLTIRGVTTEASSPLVENAVALHLDGVFQPRGAGLSEFLQDLEGIEVLRGPQGTLYGRNANGGVINLVTAKPTDVFEGSASVFGGSYERFGAKGHVSGPVADGVSVRVSGMVDRMKGFGDNLYDGSDVDGHYNWGARVSVRLQPTDDVVIDISGTHSYSNLTTPQYTLSEPLDAPGSNYSNLRALGYDTRYTLAPWEVYNTYTPSIQTKLDLVSLTAKWDITPDISLKSVSGYQIVRTWSYFDSDGMANKYNTTRSYDNSRTFSQEFNLNAKLFDRLDTVIGLYYLFDSQHGGALTGLTPGNPVGSPVTAGLFLVNSLDQIATSKAIFMDNTFSVTDDLRILAGIRRTFDKKDVKYNSATLVGNYNLQIDTGRNIDPSCGPTGLKFPVRDLKYTSTTGKLGLQYDLTQDIMAYVSWQNGFKTGGYNNARCNNTFAPEYVYSWEGGIKSTLFDGTTTFNISMFHYNYKNMQISRTINFSPTSVGTVVDNAGKSTIKGMEVELVSNFADDWSLDLGLGYLDGKFGQLSSRNGAVFGSPLVDLTGNTTPKSPKVTINAGLDYTAQLGDLGELKTRTEYSYTSKIYYTVFNEAIAKQGGYSVWNLFFTFTPADCENLSLQVFARNLTNKAYTHDLHTSGLMYWSRGTWAPPRTIGAELTAKF